MNARVKDVSEVLKSSIGSLSKTKRSALCSTNVPGRARIYFASSSDPYPKSA